MWQQQAEQQDQYNQAWSEGLNNNDFTQATNIAMGETAEPTAPTEQTAHQNILSQAKAKIAGLVARVRANKAHREQIDLFPVSAQEVAEAKQHNLDIEGFVHMIDSSAINHVIKNHGNVQTEQNRGNIAITDNDFSTIAEVLSNPEQVIYGGKTGIGREGIYSIKRMNDGSTVVLEEVRTGRKKLALTSMRRYPSTVHATSILKSLNLNARSDFEGSAVSVIDKPQPRNFAPQQPSQAVADKPIIQEANSQNGNEAQTTEPVKQAEQTKAVTQLSGNSRQLTQPTAQTKATAEQEAHRQSVQATVEKAVGKKNANHINVVNLNDILRPDNAKDLLSEGGEVEGFYNPQTQQITIIADNVDSTTASLVAWHELGHRGIDTKGFHEFKTILERADNNPTIKALADKLVESRAGTVDEAINNRLIAIEEAVVELYAAMKTKDWQAIEDKYNITIPEAMRAPKGTIGRIIDHIKQLIGKVFGIDQVSDQHIFSLLNKVDNAVHEDGQTQSEGQNRYSQSPIKSVQANIKRGREAMNKALIEKTSVHRAMYRNGMGWVDFVWGDIGNVKASGKTKGGKGLSHIIESRMRKDGMSADEVNHFLTETAVDTIAKGETSQIYRSPDNKSESIFIELNGTRITLVRQKGSNGWLMNGFKLKSDGGQRASNDATLPTQSKPTRQRQGLGASDANNPNPKNELNQDENIRYSIGKKAREKYEAQITKRNPNISPEHLKESLDFLHELEDNKENTKAIKVAVHWLSTDAIRLPFAIDNVRKAISLAEKHKIDPMQYQSPMGIINEFAVDIEHGKNVNPDRLEGFSGKRTLEIEATGETVTIYDLDDTDEAQQSVTKLLHYHFGYSTKEDMSKSPWCLSTFTRQGEPTASAQRHWFNTYTSVGKKIAIMDGKPIAFMAHDKEYDGDLWWDLGDEPSNNLPLPNGEYLDPDGALSDKKYKNDDLDQDELEQQIMTEIAYDVKINGDLPRLIASIIDYGHPSSWSMALWERFHKDIEFKVGDLLSEKAQSGELDQMIDKDVFGLDEDETYQSEYGKLWDELKEMVIDFLNKPEWASEIYQEAYDQTMEEFIRDEDYSDSEVADFARESIHNQGDPLNLFDKYWEIESDIKNTDDYTDLKFSRKATVDKATPKRQASTLAEARESAQAFVGQPLINRSTGLKAIVSGNNLRKMTNESATHKSSSPQEHALAVANADQLFINAILNESHSDKRGEPTIAAIHRYVAPMINQNGDVLAVKLTVKETTGINEPNPLYTVESLEIGKPERKAPKNGIERVIGQDRQTPQTGFNENVQQNIDEVKQALDKTRYSRKTNEADKRAWFNEMGELKIGLTAYHKLADSLRPLLGKLKLANTHPESFTRLMRDYRAQLNISTQTAQKVAQEGIKLSKAERVLLSDILEKELPLGAEISPELQEVAKNIRAIFTQQGQQLVDLEMLNPETFERMVDTYLPRIYSKYLQNLRGKSSLEVANREFHKA